MKAMWKEAWGRPGCYELWIDEINKEEAIAKLSDLKITLTKVWEERLRSTPKRFVYSYGNNYDTALESENLDDAKKEVEDILLRICQKGLVSAEEEYKKSVKYCSTVIKSLKDN